MRITFLDYFEKTVLEKTSLCAVIHNDKAITFGELRERALWFAMRVAETVNSAVNSPIAVFLPKEIDTVAADIGIMYAAAPFMNLDVKTPKERISNILERVRPAAVITSRKFAEVFSSVEIPVIFTDDDNTEIALDTQMLERRRSKLIDTDPFCIINTSGSTGTPKGVVLNHRSFFDFVDVSDEIFGFDGSEIIGSLSPVVFDIFDFELCMLMKHGSRLILLDAMLGAFPARLLENLVKTNVSFIFWVPSIMVNIANMGLLDKIKLPDLKLVWFAGEVFPTKQFLIWYDSLSHTKFANLYGPIEITLDCTYYIIDRRPSETETLPIGVPYRNTDILILNENNERCKVGEDGELCVRGTSLAMGYYNLPEKTSTVFVQNPLNSAYPEMIYRTGDVVYMRDDGVIMFKGRKDSLIKHMGYRIELGEIEHIIENDLRIIKYCCAVYDRGKKEIVLFYENDREISVQEFRKAISSRLPSYMIPAVFIKVEEMPRNTNGKIDRLLLSSRVNGEK